MCSSRARRPQWWGARVGRSGLVPLRRGEAASSVRAATCLGPCCISPWSLAAAAIVFSRMFLASQGAVRRLLVQSPVPLDVPVCPYAQRPLNEGTGLCSLHPQTAWHNGSSLNTNSHGGIPGNTDPAAGTWRGPPCLMLAELCLTQIHRFKSYVSPKFIGLSPNAQYLRMWP